MKKTTFILFSILVLGLLLRLVKFGQLPASLNRDEAALGYNAFALSIEGIDEWGRAWPITFKSFGDYKLPGYIYLLIPLISFFGAHEWVIRAPSLLAGLGTIILIYVMTAEVFPASKTQKYLSALMIAIMPWSIHYSRVAFEAHVALLLTLYAIYLLIRAKHSIINMVLSAVALLLAMLTYNAPLLLAPAVLVTYSGVFYPSFRQNKKPLIIFSILALIATGISATLVISASQAKSSITIFSDPTITSDYRQKKVALAQTNPILASVTANKYIYFGKVMGERYINTYMPTFLVFQGGQHPWHSIPGWAHFTKTQYILFLVGIMLLLRRTLRRQQTPAQRWLFYLLLFSPLPSIITVDAPHTTRSLLFLALATIPISAALASLLDARNVAKKFIASIILCIALLETGMYFSDYLTIYPNQHSSEWKVGLKQAIQTTHELPGNPPITFTDYQQSPYIYLLLYRQIPPSAFISTVQYYPADIVGLTHVKSFGRYQFVDANDTTHSGIIITSDQRGNIIIENRL